MKVFFSPSTALAIVIANMVGTGVFTSLGFQLMTLESGFALIMLWVVGGVVAICGALSYAELGLRCPDRAGSTIFSVRSTIQLRGSSRAGCHQRWDSQPQLRSRP